MRKLSFNFIVALAIAPALWAETKSAAAPQASTVTVAATTAASPAPVATPKPLWVDYTPPDWAKAHKHITWQEAVSWSKKKGYVFCDARAKAEYDQGHIPGAIPLPSGEFDKYYAMHEKRIKAAKWLITYCHGIGCRLSEKAANSLIEKGQKRVAVFFGGWPQWNEHHDKVETGDPFTPALDLTASPTSPAVVAAPLATTKTAAPKK